MQVNGIRCVQCGAILKDCLNEVRSGYKYKLL